MTVPSVCLKVAIQNTALGGFTTEAETDQGFITYLHLAPLQKGKIARKTPIVVQAV
jgi:hypothetical protein